MTSSSVQAPNETTLPLSVFTEHREASCIVCGGTSEDVVLWDNGYEGRACSCGTIYTSPEPPPNAIDPTYVGHTDAFYDLAAPLKARWVRKHTEGSALLEVGCATGSFLEAARETGFNVEGIEPSRERAHIAEQRLGAPIYRCLLEDFDPMARRYDVVYHCDMLAHFDDPRAALIKMSALLAPGGVLAFEVGLVAGLRRSWYRYLNDIGYPQHRWLYSERSLERLLKQSNLEVVASTRYDLSACIMFGQLLRSLARAKRLVMHYTRRAKPQQTSAAARTRVSLSERLLYQKFESLLRYRVGAMLPAVGPGTILVVAAPLSP